MKKGYQSPKAEKIAFEYTESVVASSIKCMGGVTIKYVELVYGCKDRQQEVIDPWAGENLG